MTHKRCLEVVSNQGCEEMFLDGRTDTVETRGWGWGMASTREGGEGLIFSLSVTWETYRGSSEKQELMVWAGIERMVGKDGESETKRLVNGKTVYNPLGIWSMVEESEGRTPKEN